MAQLTLSDLRRMTLRRQFPSVRGLGGEAVLRLFGLLGPIQSQVPRAPFLTIASRLPGVTRATIRQLFDTHQLVKTTSIRGTVHTSTREQFSRLDAVAGRQREALIRRQLRLRRLQPEEVMAEVRAFCADDWRARSDIVAHVRGWLGEHDSWESAASIDNTMAENLIWGHSGLIRRPRDQAWERRTDSYHRTAREVVPQLAPKDPVTALRELVLGHLGACGPLTREDLAFFFGVGLGQADAAVRALGEQVRRLTGPDSVEYLDLSEPPGDGCADPGLRLLPEFDALLVGYSGRHRLRFVSEEQLPRVWAKTNGLFAPVVLHDGRLVATWRTLTRGRRTDIEVRMLEEPPLSEDLFEPQLRAVEHALGLTITELRIHSP
ncbi:MAG: Winged helix DNA-binding protein [Propionibacteriaceae bacterium]|jgi:hypothetical protein|nr:Winged helix DNA-binding protein [Propionibacteriaceae bacterium]